MFLHTPDFESHTPKRFSLLPMNTSRLIQTLLRYKTILGLTKAKPMLGFTYHKAKPVKSFGSVTFVYRKLMLTKTL